MRGTRWIVVAALFVTAAAFGWFDVRERARLDRGLKRHRTDFTVYTAAATALAEGADPYEARSPRGWRYVYPPFLAVVLAPLTRLPVPDAALVWYALSVAALAAAGVATARTLGPPTPWIAAGAALALCAPFVGQCLQRGQVTTLLLASQVGALVSLRRGRDVTAGLLLAFGVAVRLTPLLLAGMVGIACLRRFLAGERAAALRFPAGLLAGLAIAFVVVPVLALGPARAREVTTRWLEIGRDVYAAEPGHLADLDRDYGIDEHSAKNQGVRRVLATVTGWASGAGFTGGRPVLSDTQARGVDLAAFAVAGAVALLAALLGWTRLRDPRSTAFRAAFAVGGLLPVLVTRYAWPVHYVLAFPVLAEAFAPRAGPRARAAGIVFVAGLLLFVVGYVRTPAFLRLPAEAGALALGAAAAVALLASARPYALAPAPPSALAPAPPSPAPPPSLPAPAPRRTP